MAGDSKGEDIVGGLLRGSLPGREFKKVRPDWLKNFTRKNLELDFYCEDLKLAVEVQGEQHWTVTDFTPTTRILHDQKGRDQTKYLLCQSKGIYLIRIYSERGVYYKKELRQELDKWYESRGKMIPGLVYVPINDAPTWKKKSGGWMKW